MQGEGEGEEAARWLRAAPGCAAVVAGDAAALPQAQISTPEGTTVV